MITEYVRGIERTAPIHLDEVKRRQAVLSVCARAVNADDAAHLLDVLGLSPAEGRIEPGTSSER